MEKLLDLSLSAVYDIEVDKNKSLSVSVSCTYFSGSTEYNYDLTFYSGATLTVKNSSGTIVQTFSTLDGSILLQAGGIFKLVKTSEEMNTVRSGIYDYDMYLSSSAFPKRAFLRGKINYIQNIAN
jgi:hypothetical protein